MNPIEYVLDNLGSPVAGRLSYPYTLEELENGNSSSAGVAWVVGFKANCPQMGLLYFTEYIHSSKQLLNRKIHP